MKKQSYRSKIPSFLPHRYVCLNTNIVSKFYMDVRSIYNRKKGTN